MNKEILNDLFDADTFVQTNSYMLSSAADAEGFPGDGVVTGYGSISGRAVFAALQDESVLKGAVGIVHAQKISACIDMAVKAGVPFVFFIDSAGARIQEGLEVLGGYGQIMKSLSGALGVIPTVAVISGQCTGAAAVIASMADFTFMPKDGAYFAFSGLDALQAASGKDCKEIGSAAAGAAAGTVSCFADSLKDCMQKVKVLLHYLPDNCDCEAPSSESGDDFSRKINAEACGAFETYDVRDLIVQIADNGDWMELYDGYAPNVVAGFARIGDRTACIIANQPALQQGELDHAACEKIAGMLAFCDKFSIPAVTLTNTYGFAASPAEEQNALSSSAALLVTSFTNSGMPKINIITGKAYGSAYLAMNGRQTGADLIYAWNGADISVITPEAGALLIYNEEIKASGDPVQARREFIEKYRREYATPVYAASKGFVDDIISPAETRSRIISALYLLD
ncbi:MAG: carboxyl transferase domain-containing protein [Clostridia bacterium]